MPDSLTFNGTTNYISFSPGAAVSTGAWTFITILKLAANAAAYKQALGVNALDSGIGLDPANPGLIYVYTGSDIAESTITISSANNWVVMGVSKADGVSTPRFHRFIYGGAWTHEDSSSGTLPTELTAFTRIIIGANGDVGSNFINADILIAGWWNSVLSDVTIETLDDNQAAWTAASPAEAWRFNTTSAITAFVGTSTENSRVGTTLSVGSAPAGWTDAAAGATQTLRPDADTTTTGWTSTPLFSKINEAAADGTVITATAA